MLSLGHSSYGSIRLRARKLCTRYLYSEHDLCHGRTKNEKASATLWTLCRGRTLQANANQIMFLLTRILDITHGFIKALRPSNLHTLHFIISINLHTSCCPVLFVLVDSRLRRIGVEIGLVHINSNNWRRHVDQLPGS
jgi:hypothetical protein